MSATIVKNGKAYEDGDVIITMLGSISYEVTNMEYSVEQEHALNYSVGSNEPTSWIAGKKKPDASITMRLSSASAIEKACGGDLLSIKPFDINVTYVNESNDVINDTLTVKFMKQGRSVGGGDDLKYQFQLFCLGVNFNNF